MKRSIIGICLVFGIVQTAPVVAQNISIVPENAKARTDTPSGLPVPRFVSIKTNNVNGRAGPDEKYPIKYTYKKQGLPVKVVAETDNWRKVEDPDGVVVWIQKDRLDGKRTLIIRPINGALNANLYNKANEKSQIIAKIAPNTIGIIIGQEAGWRKIKIGKFKGWVRAQDAWGL